MASLNIHSTSIFFFILLSFSNNYTPCNAQLSSTFYDGTCPNALRTIRTSIRTAISRERRMAASLLRLHFHDCFVQGCDASILLQDDPSNSIISERNALPNKGSVRGYEVIEAAKSEVEKLCPGVVSCADVLTVAARDASEMVGGPSWSVKLGRRDSTTASLALAETSLPSFKASLDSLIKTFDDNGLSARDMVALSGAHTIGQAQCFLFRDRIYSNGSNIDAGFASTRRRGCPINTGNGNLAPLDLVTPNSFDYNYFKNLIQKKGLLESDQVLFSGGSTDSIVSEYSNNPSKFKSDFGAAMVKMADIRPLMGEEEESSNVNHFLVVNVRTTESATRGGFKCGPLFNSMLSHESRLVIRRGLDVVPSHPPRVALSVVLTFTTKKNHSSPIFFLFIILVLVTNNYTPCKAQLSPTFYNHTCPNALSTIRTSIRDAISHDRRMAAGLLRLYFHDCFVQGCDASIFLVDDPSKSISSERNASPNKNSVIGYEVIEAAKSMVEKACPGVVSCADIIALATRDATEMVGGPTWTVKLGRRDSTTASPDLAESNLPGPQDPLDTILKLFSDSGLSARDVVALSGAHTIGKARCIFFRKRIYNGSNIDSDFAKMRRSLCPIHSVDANPGELDFQTPNAFDNNYYKNLIQKKGLLESDQVLFSAGGPTASIVSEYSNNPSKFNSDFVAAMVKLGDLKPLVGEKGVIRKVEYAQTISKPNYTLAIDSKFRIQIISIFCARDQMPPRSFQVHQKRRNASPNNNSVIGYEVIEAAKSTVEKACPGVVSCADIIALATRDATEMVGGPTWTVKLGRRDSTTASPDLAESNLPGPRNPLDTILKIFNDSGFSARDVVALSGAHTIGQARCKFFRNRIYQQRIQYRCRFCYNVQNWLPEETIKCFSVLVDRQPALFLNIATILPSLLADFAAAMVKLGDLKPLVGQKV
ncbi:hypothetical protein OSB04_008849 [Centaurea solstitialis]|uniref:Basic peroxidase n=1 Tax=Centaurea solstitialis TaxID=347529 RepID=A0AA38WTE1_9ASTR|nr:hypothetical protein OSB04_008849 [Centaurea solstitialis]